MGSIWVKEFTGGLDTRRMPETASGAVLIKATNGHINRGGEFEKRAAFVAEYALPAGTIGLAHDKNGVFVFGHQATPIGLPVGVSYQRLQHPDGVTALVRVPSFDLYAGKIYAVGEFADGSLYHFYDGVRVTDFNDGRARASFRVTDGSVQPATRAVGSFEVTGGSSGVGNQITTITIDGVAIISGAISFGASTADTASAIASAINSHTSSPDYTASANGQTVTVTAAATGPTVNGKAVIVTTGGDVTVGNSQVMAGGADIAASALTALTVDGVVLIAAPVNWSTSNSATASAIAAAVNAYSSTPDYTATAVGDQVNVIAAAAGTTANGKVVAFGLANGLVVTPSSGLTMAGGTDTTLVPGSFVKTIGSRMHCVSGPNEHFSGIRQPTKWTTDTTGAGFIDMSTQASGAEVLTSLATYQKYVAVFAERVVQIWLFDSDPNNNAQIQVLNNTGTASPRSVTQFGDNDLFYCDESGLRSLRARDSSNAAATTDIGVPVDTLIVEKLRTLTTEERNRVTGLIEPRDGRFWLVMKDMIFVFSYFPGSKISAWSTYEPGFDIDDAVVFRRRVYVRSGDDIYVYGGLDTEFAYDATEAEAWLPYLDAGQPARTKDFNGMDAAVEGEWRVGVALRPTNEGVEDDGPVIYETTYGRERVPLTGSSTHISVRCKSVGTGPATLSAVVVHFEGDDNED
ncbi:MAG: hypothetical protein HYU59_05760 [Magnetospirillum gryphiswaldense]|nr:hypothetical protein [Magnetospirillum gryphiswaldense]